MNQTTLERGFSPARVWYLFRNRVFDDAAVIGIGAAIAIALNLLNLLVGGRALYNLNDGFAWPATIAAGGCFLAAGAFKGMHDGKAGAEWILLPATPLEKYLAALVAYAIAFPLAGSLASMGLSGLLSLVERAAGGPGSPVWSPFVPGFLRCWADYGLAVAAFLAGSAAFRKAPFIRTSALVVAYFLAAGGLLVGGAWLVFRGAGLEHASFDNGILLVAGDAVSEGAQRLLQGALDLMRYALAPAFALLYGWAKVAEKEARDEVQ